MGCCRVKNFCGSGTLQHGAITAAVLTGIITICTIAYGTFTLLRIDNIKEIIRQETRNNPRANKDELEHIYTISMTVVGWVYIAIGIIAFISLVCLIIGIVKRIAGLVLIWLIGAMIIIVVTCLSNIPFLFIGNFTVLLTLLFIAFYIYLWIVVVNYYYQDFGYYHQEPEHSYIYSFAEK